MRKIIYGGGNEEKVDIKNWGGRQRKNLVIFSYKL